MSVSVQVSMEGPVFYNGGVVVDKVTKEFLQHMVELGEGRLNEMLQPRPAGVFLSVSEAQPGKVSTGNYRRNVSGEVTAHLGMLITDGGVVYGPWLENGSTGTRFKGYASFRKVGQWLGKQVSGESKKFMKRYYQKLNGRK